MSAVEARLQKILVATDGSRHADTAAALAADLAAACRAAILLVHVVEPPNPPSYPPSDQQVLANRSIARLEHVFDDKGVDYVSEILEGSAAETILDLAEQGDLDLIALGNRGLGALRRFFLGSVSDKVLHHTPCAMLLGACPEDGDRIVGTVELERVLIATDGSDDAQAAAALGAALADTHGAHVRVMSAIAPLPPTIPTIPLRPEYLGALESAAEEVVKAAADAVAVRGVEAETRIVHGTPVGAILGEAEQYDADLTVMGRRGVGKMTRLLLGSTASGVVHGSQRSVLVGIAP